MTDKSSIQQVIGCLMKQPVLLSQVDKYSLTVDDFSNRFEKYIFSAIVGLYRQNATHIEPIDVASYLDSDAVATLTFNKQNGIEYLQDVLEFSSVENFDYYYNKLKKINLLRDLKKQGIDISDFYEEDISKPNAEEINQRFEYLSTKDICDGIKKKLLHLESSYVKTGEVVVENAAEGMQEFLHELDETISIGLPVQGHIYNKIISGAEKGALTIRSGSSGLGKALPNSTLIPTPMGWKRVDEIKVGDYLFDAFGKPTKVLNIYPQGKKEVWEITFKDGRTAKCCNEHLWSYWTRTQKTSSIQNRRFITKTLAEIETGKKGKYDILIPQQYAVTYPTQKHLIPPYIMGLILGDGSFRQQETNKQFQYSSEDEYLPQIIASTMGWYLKRGSSKNYNWYFATKLTQDNVKEKINIWVEDVLSEHPELINASSQTKFIPRNYIEDSIENRFALLNGLLDSDGTVDKKGRVSYFTISEQLRDGVVEIARSLGFKTHVIVDTHKQTSVGYVITITGRPVDKVKLFNLPRKKQIIEEWYNNGHRKEGHHYNSVEKIENLHYMEEMTCFYVDNEEHLFLMNDFIVTHNTRQAVADACYLAYPIRYNATKRQWEQEGSSEKVLFIVTEQTFEQVRKMIMAYLTDIAESRFKFGSFSEEEKEIIGTALDLMEIYKDNLILVKCPNPSIELIKLLIRENCLTRDIGYVFYDYIFIGPALLSEFRGFALRNDEILLMLATALKDLAVELNVAMFTSTQVNASADDNRNIRNEASLAGGRSTINKADNGAIMARPTPDELETLQPLTEQFGIPNLVTDVFKARSGEWTQVRIWSNVDLGRMRKRDLFITDARLDAIEGFFGNDDDYRITNWEDGEEKEIMDLVCKLNRKEV